MLSAASALGTLNIGAGERKRAVDILRYACCQAGGFGCFEVCVVQLFAEPVVGLFTDSATSDGADVIRGHRLEICGFSREITMIDQGFILNTI